MSLFQKRPLVPLPNNNGPTYFVIIKKYIGPYFKKSQLTHIMSKIQEKQYQYHKNIFIEEHPGSYKLT